MNKPGIPLTIAFRTWRQAGRFAVVWAFGMVTLLAVGTLIA